MRAFSLGDEVTVWDEVCGWCSINGPSCIYPDKTDCPRVQAFLNGEGG